MSGYPSSFRRRRTYDLVRFGYACARCSAEDQPMGLYTNLERAHLDGHTGNNDDDNIAVLCRRCHRAHDYVEWGRKFAAWVRAERDRRAGKLDAKRPLLQAIEEWGRAFEAPETRQ